MLRRLLTIPVLFSLALYLTPVSAAHFCHFFSEGDHHGSCEHHPTPPSGAYKTPHDNNCFDFEKAGERTLSNSPLLGLERPDIPVPEVGTSPAPGWTSSEQELRLPVRSDTTDPPDQTNDPTRGPPVILS